MAHRSQKGKVTGYIGTAIDLTEHVESEEIIQKLNTHLTSILDNAYDGIATLDAQYHFRSCNKVGCELLGYSDSELFGKNGSVEILLWR